VIKTNRLRRAAWYHDEVIVTIVEFLIKDDMSLEEFIHSLLDTIRNNEHVIDMTLDEQEVFELAVFQDCILEFMSMRGDLVL